MKSLQRQLMKSLTYHDQDEAIYYYCFLHKLPYSHYQMIKNAISVYDSEIISDVSENMYTMKIRDKITNCASDNELISFLAKYKIVFEKFNLSATQQIQKYMYEIQNPKNGLAVLEYQNYLESLYAEEKETQPYKYLQKGSVDFTLTIIFNGFVNVIKKNHDIPMIVRQNFPDKSVFSRLLSDVPKDTRYMMRRKTLILLYFYYFFAKIKLGQLDISEGEQADSFMEQLNEILESCGYDELFAGNPYDWLYMWAAYSDDPLTSFRDAIAYCDVEDGESS